MERVPVSLNPPVKVLYVDGDLFCADGFRAILDIDTIFAIHNVCTERAGEVLSLIWNTEK